MQSMRKDWRLIHIMIYFTIIDYTEVDMMIYLPEKNILRGRKAKVNITFNGG